MTNIVEKLARDIADLVHSEIRESVLPQMIADMIADSGTLLPPDAVAMSCGPDGEMNLLMPSDGEHDSRVMNAGQLFIAASFMRSHDEPDFAEDQISWFHAKYQRLTNDNR